MKQGSDAAKEMEVAVIAAGTVSAVDVYVNKGMDPLLGKIKEHVLSFVPDVTTKKGRGEIASMAYKVAQTKTLLDNLGKDLTADWKAKAKVVDEERKRMREELDALKDKVRTPLTEFENREKERIASLLKRLYLIKALAVDVDDAGNKLSSKQLAERLVAAKGVDIESFEEMVADAALAKDKAILALEANITSREREEAEAAELERLRKEAAEREQREMVERIRREAEEKAKKEAAEAARKEREQREREKAEAEAAILREREETARREAEAEARRIADIKAANDKAEREKAELMRQYEEKERIAKAKKEAAEEAERKRQEDVQHRTAVNNNILRSFMSYGCDEETGTAIIKAMIAGSVPHVSVNY